MAFNKLLTICVPTRNRCAAMRRTIDAICRQVVEDDVLAAVEVMVFDNCSDDKTPSYLAALQVGYPHLTCHRPAEWASFDLGLQRFFELATSKYVWTLNDHSSILPGVLKKIVPLLEGDYHYIFAPAAEDLERAQEVAKCCKPFLGFLNMVMNTNIYNARQLLPFYKKHMVTHDDSWIVNHISALDMLFTLSPEGVMLLPFACSEYGTYRDATREANSWGSKWEGYLKIGYHLGLGVAEIKAAHGISTELLRKVCSLRTLGCNACGAYLSLRRNGSPISPGKAAVIISHPTYNGIERMIIRGALCAGDRQQLFYKLLFQIYWRVLRTVRKV